MIKYPNSNNRTPDFTVLTQQTELGEVISPFLSHYNLDTKFYLVDKYDTYETALANFVSYELPVDYDVFEFDEIAYMVQPNQIWLVKLKSEKLGIILIKSTRHHQHNNNPYAEVTFKAKRLN